MANNILFFKFRKPTNHPIIATPSPTPTTNTLCSYISILNENEAIIKNTFCFYIIY